MGEGDNTFGYAASKMGRGAFMVCVVGGPAVPAAPVIRAVTGLVSRVLAVAPEAVDVGWECSLVLPKRAARWGPWVLHHSSLDAVFPFAVLWVAIRGSLCCMDARDNAARGGSGASVKEVRNQTRPDCCVCQVMFHLIPFLFSFELLSP